MNNVSESKAAIVEALAQYFLTLKLNLLNGNSFGLSAPCYDQKVNVHYIHYSSGHPPAFAMDKVSFTCNEI